MKDVQRRLDALAKRMSTTRREIELTEPERDAARELLVRWRDEQGYNKSDESSPDWPDYLIA